MNTMSTSAARPLAGKRILIGKPGLDGHDIGAKIIALTLRDAGADVTTTPDSVECPICFDLPPRATSSSLGAATRRARRAT